MVRALKFARSPNRQLRRLLALDFPLIPAFSHYSRRPASLIELPDRICFSQIASIMLANVRGPTRRFRLRNPTIWIAERYDRRALIDFGEERRLRDL